MRAIGVDGARAGWVAACREDDGSTRLALLPDVAAVAELAAGACVAIDVPIGLLDSVGFRACDREARARLGAARSTVFAPPSRPLLAAAGDYAAMRALVAAERATDPAAKSLSAQSAALAPKIAEVDAWVRAHPASAAWLFECHPELAWRALGTVTASKHTPAGLAERRALAVAAFGPLAPATWRRRDATQADALDAYAALWTAERCARGEQTLLGAGEHDRLGLPMRIVF